MTDQTRPMDAEELELIRERHETSLDASPSSCDYCVDENGNPVPLGTCDAAHLLAEVARLTAERDAARKRADERCEFDYKDGYENGRVESDATLLETVSRLRAEVARLSAERDELESLRKTDAAALRGVGAQVLRLESELSRLRAVVEEARGMHDEPAAVNPGLCGMCMDARPCDTFSILDRGLKGAAQRD